MVCPRHILKPQFSANATHFALLGKNPSCGIVNNYYGFAEVRVWALEDTEAEPVAAAAPEPTPTPTEEAGTDG